MRASDPNAGRRACSRVTVEASMDPAIVRACVTSNTNAAQSDPSAAVARRRLGSIEFRPMLLSVNRSKGMLLLVGHGAVDSMEAVPALPRRLPA
jgi:hypothetical protein